MFDCLRPAASSRTISRRSIIAAGCACLAWPAVAHADEVAVPVDLQAELLAKVAGYDKNFASRAGENALVLVVSRDEPGSKRTSAHIERALGAQSTIGGLPASVGLVTFSDAARLRAACASRRAAVVYLSSGMLDDVPAIAEALSGVDVLSVSATPGCVPRGAVLGFDLLSGKPKLLVNLTQAKRQNVAFRAEVLKMMKVFE